MNHTASLDGEQTERPDFHAPIDTLTGIACHPLFIRADDSG